MMFRQSVLFVSQRRSIRELVTKRREFQPLVQRFVAGETIAEAVEATRSLNKTGTSVSLDHLGESVQSVRDSCRAAADYIDLLDAIDASHVDANVSLKLTHMGLDLGRELAVENVRLVTDRARALGTFVRVDMESSDYTDTTLEIIEELWTTGSTNMGVVIQACLNRSQRDIQWLNGLGMKVRLCKGAYLEPEGVAIRRKADVDANFLVLARELFDSGTYPAFATHDSRLIQEIRRFATEREIEKSSFEFQMLYGVRRDLQRLLVAEGYRVRVYVPFGTAWYPYLTRRLAERPANLLFFVRATVNG